MVPFIYSVISLYIAMLQQDIFSGRKIFPQITVFFYQQPITGNFPHEIQQHPWKVVLCCPIIHIPLSGKVSIQNPGSQFFGNIKPCILTYHICRQIKIFSCSFIYRFFVFSYPFLQRFFCHMIRMAGIWAKPISLLIMFRNLYIPVIMPAI